MGANDRFLEIRDGCEFRGKGYRYGSLIQQPDQCYHRGLPWRADCCSGLCPKLAMENAVGETKHD